MKIKIFASFLLLLSFASPVYAMTTPILVMNPLSNVVNNLPRDFALEFNGGNGGANGLGQQTIMPISGTFSNLTMTLYTPLTSGSYDFTLLKAGASTTETCRISSGSSSCSDTTHTVSVAAGDLVSMRLTPVGTPTPGMASSLYGSISFDGSTAGESFIVSAFRSPGTAVTTYGPVGYGEPSNLTFEQQSAIVFPTSGTLDQLNALSGNPPGAGKSWTYSLRQGTTLLNEATTTLSCQIAGTNTSCSDSTDSVSVSAGDVLSIVNLGGSTPLANQVSTLSMRFRPTIDGESVMIARTNTGVGSTVSTFGFTGGSVGNQGVEASTSAPSPVAFVWKKEYVLFDGAPGTLRSRAYVSRVNGVSQALSCSVSSAATSCNDTTHSVNVSAGDLIDWLSSPLNTPGGSVNNRFSAVMFINPSTGPPPALLAPSKFRIFGGKFSIVGGRIIFQ